MGFRADLDVRDYTRACGWDDMWAPRREAELSEHPVRRGGVLAFTTCRVIVVRYSIWDANGYYTALGFTFPYRGIGRPQLRVAYNDHTEAAGIEDEYLTYIVGFLINPARRAFYNSLPFCEPFWDKYRSEWVKSHASTVAGARSATGGAVSQSEVLDEWGLVDTGEDDDVPSPSRDVSQDSEEGGTFYVWNWRWGYYLWRVREPDLYRLARWQELLVAAYATRGVHRIIAVGLMGQQPQRVKTCLLEEHLVYFLREDVEPTQELAESALDEIVTGELTNEEN